MPEFTAGQEFPKTLYDVSTIIPRTWADEDNQQANKVGRWSDDGDHTTSHHYLAGGKPYPVIYNKRRHTSRKFQNIYDFADSCKSFVCVYEILAFRLYIQS